MSKSMAPDESGYGYYESDNGTITITTQDTQDYTFNKNTYSIDDTVTVSLDTDNTFTISDSYDPMYLSLIHI